MPVNNVSDIQDRGIGAKTYVMLVLVELVTNGILGSRGTCSEGSLVVLGDLLVGLLGCLGGCTLDGVGDVVGGVPIETTVSSHSR